jgi:uncharacterized membrane protein YfcA
MSGPMIAAMLGLGVAAGVLGGLFGIGGGLVIVPVLVLAFGLDQKTATGTSLFALLWPVGILGVREYYRRGELRIDLGAWIAAGLVLGILVGAMMTKPMSAGQLKRAYGVLLMVVGLYYLFGTPSSTPAPVPPVEARPAGR